MNTAAAPVRTVRILASTRLPGICRTCRARITWARTYPGLKLMPLHGNPPAISTDNIDGDAIETINATETHFARCPHAKRWKQAGLRFAMRATDAETLTRTTTRLFILCPRATVPVEMGPLTTRWGVLGACVVCGETHPLPYLHYEREINLQALMPLLPRLVELAAADVRDPELVARLAQFVAHEAVRLRAGKDTTTAMGSNPRKVGA